MLDYGFWERKGAMLSPGWRVGLIEHPEAHNYVNHPYPIIWLYALLYSLFGKAGMYVFIAFRSLATALMTYAFLGRLFSRPVAMFASILAIASYGMIEFTMNTDVIGQGVIIWPLAGLLLLNLKSNPLKSTAILLGVAIFFVGQITWFALSVTPALLFLCIPEQTNIRLAASRVLKLPGVVPLILGASLSAALFICQVFAYTPAVVGNSDYLKMQMGLVTNEASSRVGMLPVLLLRMLVAAPGLWLGAIVGAALCLRDSKHGRLAAFSGFYFLTFAGIVFCIPRLLFLNQHGFSYMVFPCAIMTGIALDKLSSKVFRSALATVGIVGLLICYAKLHDYRASNASLALGSWISQNTQKNDIVVSNYRFEDNNPPIQDWDFEFLGEASVAADRFLFKEINNGTDLKSVIAQFGSNSHPLVYLNFASMPPSQIFLNEMAKKKTGDIEASIEIPHESPRYFKSLRRFLWQHLPGSAPWRSAKALNGGQTNKPLQIQLIRLPQDFADQLSRDQQP